MSKRFTVETSDGEWFSVVNPNGVEIDGFPERYREEAEKMARDFNAELDADEALAIEGGVP